MLDNYLESNIIDQKNILAILLADTNTSLDKICAKTHLSPKQVKHYIIQMNNLFQKSLQITITKTKVCCHTSQASKKTLFNDIFSLSDTLKLLRFLLIETKQRKSISSFTRRHFISLSKAYRLIDKLKAYLQAIGLTIDHYQIVGEEFRIRYLIALLHKKYGIMIYSITATDINIINSFVLSPRKPCAAKPLDESFLFFHILLMLSWKR